MPEAGSRHGNCMTPICVVSFCSYINIARDQGGVINHSRMAASATAMMLSPMRGATRPQQCQRCLHFNLSLWRSRPNAEIIVPVTKRCFSASLHRAQPPAPPKNKDRGPASKEDTQTDFNAMDILAATPAPTTAVDSCMNDGFALNSGMKVTGSGVLLVGGEAFRWQPWQKEGRKEDIFGAGGLGNDKKGVSGVGGKILNARGQFEVDEHAWGVLDLVWPKPDLLILGTGRSIVPVSPQTRMHLMKMGIRVEVQDTRNAAAQYNLLATERGVQQIVGALIPIGWRTGG